MEELESSGGTVVPEYGEADFQEGGRLYDAGLEIERLTDEGSPRPSLSPTDEPAQSPGIRRINSDEPRKEYPPLPQGVADLVDSGSLPPLDTRADPVIHPPEPKQPAAETASHIPSGNAEVQEPSSEQNEKDTVDEANEYLERVALSFEEGYEYDHPVDLGYYMLASRTVEGEVNDELMSNLKKEMDSFLRVRLPEAIVKTNRGANDPLVRRVFSFLNNPQRVIAIQEIQKLKGITPEGENG